MSYIFEHEMKVRDYECDVQGVVNNANYQHYIEHARHEYLESKGVSFSSLHDKGIDVMVSRVNIVYRHSLRGSDRFVVKLKIKRTGVKLIVQHDIFKLPEGTLCAQGTVDIISVVNGKLTRGELFDELFAKELAT